MLTVRNSLWLKGTLLASTGSILPPSVTSQQPCYVGCYLMLERAVLPFFICSASLRSAARALWGAEREVSPQGLLSQSPLHQYWPSQAGSSPVRSLTFSLSDRAANCCFSSCSCSKRCRSSCCACSRCFRWAFCARFFSSFLASISRVRGPGTWGSMGRGSQHLPQSKKQKREEARAGCWGVAEGHFARGPQKARAEGRHPPWHGCSHTCLGGPP